MLIDCLSYPILCSFVDDCCLDYIAIWFFRWQSFRFLLLRPRASIVGFSIRTWSANLLKSTLVHALRTRCNFHNSYHLTNFRVIGSAIIHHFGALDTEMIHESPGNDAPSFCALLSYLDVFLVRYWDLKGVRVLRRHLRRQDYQGLIYRYTHLNSYLDARCGFIIIS